jgi:DNA-binding SARP family transcriptional activator
MKRTRVASVGLSGAGPWGVNGLPIVKRTNHLRQYEILATAGVTSILNLPLRRADIAGVADHEVQAQRKLSVSLFGSLRVEGDGGVLGPRSFGGVKPKQVLEILLLKRGRPVPKDVLADLIWSENLPRNADATLATYVSVLRRELAKAMGCDTPVIVTSPGAYAIDFTVVDLDLDRFDQLLAAGSDMHPRLAQASMINALDLVVGDVLEDEPYAEWAMAERERYARAHLHALLDMVRSSIAADDFESAWTRVSQATRMDPMHEASHRLQMLVAYGRGDADGALAVYRRFAQRLEMQLGVDVSEDTKGLAGAIEKRMDVSELLGFPRRRDVLAPAEVTPAGPLPFLGRSHELRIVREQRSDAANGTCRIVVVRGERGCGKTRFLDEVKKEFTSWNVAAVSCTEIERSLHFATVASLLRCFEAWNDNATALRESLFNSPSDNNEMDLADAFAGLVASSGPTAIVVDDMQWADAASFDVLVEVAQRCENHAVLILGSWSSEDGDELALRWMSPNVDVELGPLTERELAPLGEPGLYEKTGGLPMFVAECFGTSGRRSSEASMSLSQSVVARWRAEGADAFNLLVMVAIHDGVVTAQQLATMMNRRRDGVESMLETFVQLGALVETRGGFDFRFPIVRNVLRRTLSPEGWRLARGRSAQRIEA